MLLLQARQRLVPHVACALRAAAAHGGTAHSAFVRGQHAQAAREEPAGGSAARDTAPGAAHSVGPLALYESGIRSGRYREDAQQVRVRRPTARRELSCTLLAGQMVTVQKLQRVWDELDTGAPEGGSSSGLTLVDAVDEAPSSGWKLWSLITRGALDDRPASPPVKGLYLYGAPPQPHCGPARSDALRACRRRGRGQDDADGCLLRLPAAGRSPQEGASTDRQPIVRLQLTRARRFTSTTLCWTCTGGCGS